MASILSKTGGRLNLVRSVRKTLIDDGAEPFGWTTGLYQYLSSTIGPAKRWSTLRPTPPLAASVLRHPCGILDVIMVLVSTIS